MSKTSETRRVNFTTISSTTSSTGFPNFNEMSTTGTAMRFGNDLFAEPKGDSTIAASNETKNQKTLRLSLDFTPTDKSNYPEINYARLMRLEDKKRKKLKQKTNGTGTGSVAASSSMPFEENDDDVARIAAELEKKYGSAYGRSRGRSKRDDQCDIGMGYDESDSFIDNTDAYDEVMPEDVEAVEGGFYINCGALEFKHLNNETVKLKTDEIIKMPKKSKKRLLSTSSSEGNSSPDDEESANANALKDGENEDAKSNDKIERIDSESSESTAKSKNNFHPVNKKHKKDKTSTKSQKAAIIHQNGKKKEKEKALPGVTFSSSNSPKSAPVVDEVGSDGSDKDRGGNSRPKTVRSTTIKDMLKAKRDSFLKMQGGGVEGKSINGELRGAASKSSGDDTSDSSENDDCVTDSDSNRSATTTTTQGKTKVNKKSEGASNSEENIEKLRSNDTPLPELEVEIVTHIQKFKELVKTKNINGKRFQFDDELTEIFLRIDESLLCIDKSHRNMVYAHLEFHLLQPKSFFLRKAKQLRIKEEKSKTQRALAKLRKAVVETMPAVIASYDAEIRKYTEQQIENLQKGQPPPFKIPKKKFPWNTFFRNLLYDVYQTRWISYPVLSTRKQSLEDFITVYLKEQVVEIWPSGWMRNEELQKEIEKRKQANKKSKEKKTDAITSSSSSTTTTTAPPPTLGTAATFAKQLLEDFPRSCGNSDTDSVASSSTSNGSSLKRKATVDDFNTKNKNKGVKLTNVVGNNSNGTMVTSGSAEFISLTSTAELESQTLTINTDSHSKTTTVSGSSSNVLPYTTTPVSSTNANNVNHVQDMNLKHSTSQLTSTTKHVAHIIDLDQYNSASDILEKSKQLQKATTTTTTKVIPSDIAAIHAQYSAAPITHRANSSDSDGVEIVGVFQAMTKPNPAPPKQRSKKNQQQPHSNTVSATSLYTNNNNNNNKKHISSATMQSSKHDGVNVMTGAFDVNKAVNALKEFERLQQPKTKNSAVPAKESLQ